MANAPDDQDPTPPSMDTDDGAWPRSFPHRSLDALLDQLENADHANTAEAALLLGMVAREAERLRGTVVRLSSSKLSQADREARAIVEEAVAQADTLRSVGLSVLDHRLDEAERVFAAMRHAFKVELRAAQLIADAERRADATRCSPAYGGAGIPEDV